MPVYTDFNTIPPSDYGNLPIAEINPPIPILLDEPPALRQLSHSAAKGGRINYDGIVQAVPGDVEEFLIPGFRSLDEGMKRYWSGIRVPTKDAYRFMRVKIAGGDRSLLVWNDELKGGRARLPVAAIDRSGHEFNPEKYSPSTLPMALKYPTNRGNYAIKVFRPLPYLVEYKMYVWGERKRDLDYILYQILTRFSPLAEFWMNDGKIAGTVVLKFGGSTDASDKEVGFDQYANCRYEISMTAEAWLPLPEKMVPTVLGRVTVLQERVGQILLANFGTNAWIEPGT